MTKRLFVQKNGVFIQKNRPFTKRLAKHLEL